MAASIAFSQQPRRAAWFTPILSARASGSLAISRASRCRPAPSSIRDRVAWKNAWNCRLLSSGLEAHSRVDDLLGPRELAAGEVDLDQRPARVGGREPGVGELVRVRDVGGRRARPRPSRRARRTVWVRWPSIHHSAHRIPTRRAWARALVWTARPSSSRVSSFVVCDRLMYARTAARGEVVVERHLQGVVEQRQRLLDPALARTGSGPWCSAPARSSLAVGIASASSSARFDAVHRRGQLALEEQQPGELREEVGEVGRVAGRSCAPSTASASSMRRSASSSCPIVHRASPVRADARAASCVRARLRVQLARPRRTAGGSPRSCRRARRRPRPAPGARRARRDRR